MAVIYSTDGKALPVIHILADGRRVENLSCVELPAGHPAYQIIRDAAARIRKQEQDGKI